MDNHFALDLHSFTCKDEECSFFNISSRKICEMNKQNVVLFINNDFYIFSYNRCISYDKYEFLEDVIKKITKNVKVKNVFSVNRSFNINQDFKENRLRGLQFKTHLEDINFTYTDNSNKKYAIVTKRNYVDYVFDKEFIHENKLKCENYIKNSILENKNELLKNLENLYDLNNVILPSKIEIHKTVESLIKQIKVKL